MDDWVLTLMRVQLVRRVKDPTKAPQLCSGTWQERVSRHNTGSLLPLFPLLLHLWTDITQYLYLLLTGELTN